VTTSNRLLILGLPKSPTSRPHPSGAPVRPGQTASSRSRCCQSRRCGTVSASPRAVRDHSRFHSPSFARSCGHRTSVRSSSWSTSRLVSRGRTPAPHRISPVASCKRRNLGELRVNTPEYPAVSLAQKSATPKRRGESEAMHQTLDQKVSFPLSWRMRGAEAPVTFPATFEASSTPLSMVSLPPDPPTTRPPTSPEYW
jgi:hypothetical protein